MLRAENGAKFMQTTFGQTMEYFNSDLVTSWPNYIVYLAGHRGGSILGCLQKGVERSVVHNKKDKYVSKSGMDHVIDL